jgi:hypothetical protein
VRDRRIPDRREQLAHDPLERLMNLIHPIERVVHFRSEVIRSAPAPDRDAIIGRSLRIDQQVTTVVDRLASIPPELRPHALV